MRKLFWLPAILALAVLATPTLAEEIIYFTNGSSMPIRSHEIDGEMIKVDLGGDAFIAFPMSQVDRIEMADGDINLRPSSQANQILTPSASSQVYATPGDRAKGLPDVPQGLVVAPDSKGVASYAPFANSGHRGKEKLRIAGDQTVLNQRAAQAEGITGASRVGQRAALPGKTPGKKPLRGLTGKND